MIRSLMGGILSEGAVGVLALSDVRGQSRQAGRHPDHDSRVCVLLLISCSRNLLRTAVAGSSIIEHWDWSFVEDGRVTCGTGANGRYLLSAFCGCDGTQDFEVVVVGARCGLLGCSMP